MIKGYPVFVSNFMYGTYFFSSFSSLSRPQGHQRRRAAPAVVVVVTAILVAVVVLVVAVAVAVVLVFLLVLVLDGLAVKSEMFY